MMSVRLNWVVLAVLLSISPFARSAPAASCLNAFSPAFEPNPVILEKWVEEGREGALRSPTPKYPTSLRMVSRTERIRNEIFFRLFQSLKPLSRTKEQVGLNKFLETLHRFTTYVRSSPIEFLFRGSLFTRLTMLLNHPLIRQGDRVDLSRFIGFQREYLVDLQHDRTEYGAKFYNEETIAQGAINSFSIKMFAALNGLPQPYDRPSVNSISILHPLLDSAMDQGLMTKETFQKLDKNLSEGAKPTIESDYERVLFGYIDRFESAFPRKVVPGFWFSLDRLYRLQVESLRQKHEVLSDEGYYDIALAKGGLSTVLAAYTALGPLTQPQYEFFFRAGGIFQVIDDLLDIDKDQREGVRTIWTSRLERGESLLQPTQQLLSAVAQLENEMPRLTSGFREPATFAGIYSFGFKLSLFRGLARQRARIDSSTKNFLAGRYSVSLGTIEKLMKPASPGHSAPEGSDLWLVEQLIKSTDAY